MRHSVLHCVRAFCSTELYRSSAFHLEQCCLRSVTPHSAPLALRTGPGTGCPLGVVTVGVRVYFAARALRAAASIVARGAS